MALSDRPPQVGRILRNEWPDVLEWIPGPSLLVQETHKKDPHANHLFVFGGRREPFLRQNQLMLALPISFLWGILLCVS